MRLIGRRYREALRRQVTRVYQLACVLRDDSDIWLEFCRHEFWGSRGPRDNDRAEALKFALKFACGDGRSAQQRASKYWRALRKWFAANIPADEIADRVKRAGGWQKCADNNAQPTKVREDAKHDDRPASSSGAAAQPDRLPVLKMHGSQSVIEKLIKAKRNSTVTITGIVVAVDEKAVTIRAQRVRL